MEDYVILVDENNQPIGTAEKYATHNDNTPLHRGFSVFLFNREGKLLLQQRSSKKKTWPNAWSNSCCGHPQLQETSIDAAKRRLVYELGITEVDVLVVLPDYRYRVEKDGIVENEFCPVMVASSVQVPTINPDEVREIKWISWEEWLEEIKQHPQEYSQWCIEETQLLSGSPIFQDFLETHNAKRKLPNK